MKNIRFIWLDGKVHVVPIQPDTTVVAAFHFDGKCFTAGYSSNKARKEHKGK
jgi:hypothetical protein